MVQHDYKYYAFISFQSADAAWALRVQKLVEGYRLPIALQRQHGLPPRIKPCFCYLTDINLNEELMTELQARIAESKYLIVICSPASAKSTFVNGGIDRFVQLGRRDRIIPFIVDGVPYSGDPETECFPEALRRHFPKSSDPFQDHQILGVNVHEEGTNNNLSARKRAIVMVVARMLGLDVNELIRREIIRQRRRRLSIAAAILAVCALIFTTWYINQPFEQPVAIEEELVSADLPARQATHLSLYLSGETKSATVDNASAVFANIPAGERGHEVRLTAEAKDFLPLDTIVIVGKPITLSLHRDPMVYGHLSAILMTADALPLAGVTITIAGYNATTDVNGRFSLDIPLSEQKSIYPVLLSNARIGEIYPPCGPNDVIIVE